MLLHTCPPLLHSIRRTPQAGRSLLRSACPGRVFRLIAVDADMPDVHRLRDRLLALMHPSGAVMDLNLGTVLWLATMARGRLLVGTAPKHESETHTCTSPATDDSPSQQGMTAPPATDGHAQRQATAPRRRRRVRPEPPGPSYPADPSSPLVTSAARVVLLVRLLTCVHATHPTTTRGCHATRLFHRTHTTLVHTSWQSSRWAGRRSGAEKSKGPRSADFLFKDR